MSKPKQHLLTFAPTALLALCMILACAEEKNGGSTSVGTETNWLKTCTTSAECGSYTCECGVCTTRCATTSQCSMEGALCVASDQSAHADLCGADPSNQAGLCLAESAVADDDGNDDDGANVDSELPGPIAETPSDTTSTDPSNAPGTDGEVASDAEPSATTTDDVAPPTNDETPTEPDPDAPAPVPTEPADAGTNPDPEATDAAPHVETNDAGDATPAPDADDVPTGELLQGYILWDRPGGFAGTGPSLELLEDGTLRLWQSTARQYPRETSDWQLELELAPEQVDEIVRLLQAVDYTDLPHEVSFGECYPRLYFEGPAADVIEIDYGAAEALLPEMEAVYDWFDALFASEAPEFQAPSLYCALSE